MQAEFDEILRTLDKAWIEFVGIEHLIDAQICAIRDALESDIKSENGKDHSAERSVEALLKRY